MSFSKMEDRKVKQVLSGGWHQWEGGGYKERV
jgi:chitinase